VRPTTSSAKIVRDNEHPWFDEGNDLRRKKNECQSSFSPHPKYRLIIGSDIIIFVLVLVLVEYGSLSADACCAGININMIRLAPLKVRLTLPNYYITSSQSLTHSVTTTSIQQTHLNLGLSCHQRTGRIVLHILLCIDFTYWNESERTASHQINSLSAVSSGQALLVLQECFNDRLSKKHILNHSTWLPLIPWP